MDRCRVVVTFEMKEEAIPGFREILEKSTPHTLAEKGCLAAGMYQDMQHPTHFRCIEDWESYDDLMYHLRPDKPEDPEDASLYIKANMIGKDTFHYYRKVFAMKKD